ncbi:MAG: hypothetical protein JOZ32_07540 [Bryobacterales bacterium]|nr:hypothetical protein [Bryobacterales bacterium]
MGSFRITSLIVGLGIVLISSSAHASILTAPQGPTTPDVFSPCPTCTVLDAISLPGSGTSVNFIEGAAVFSDPNNPFGANDLDFAYTILDDAYLSSTIARITVSGFTGLSTDAGDFSTGSFPGVEGTVASTSVDRLTSNTVGFDFNSLVPGDQTLVLVVKTDATGSNFSPGMLDVTAYPTPEPSLFWLLASGLVATVVYRRTLGGRRRRLIDPRCVKTQRTAKGTATF